MRRQQTSFIHLLICILLSAHTVYADVEVVFYTSYGAEVKKSDSETWEFIKVGQKLNATDLLRVPPDVILRVKTEGDLIKIPKGREGFVDDLIRGAKAHNNRKYGKGWPLETQILETDWDASKMMAAGVEEKGGGCLKTPLDIESLRASASVDRATLQQILGAKKAPSDESYPYRNMGYAKQVFKRLQQEIEFRKKGESDNKLQSPEQTWATKTADEAEFAIMYLALLKAQGIGADFKQNSQGEIFVLFDSGRTAKQVNTITANRDLYHSEADGVWLPLCINPLNKNFVMSWYLGGAALKSE